MQIKQLYINENIMKLLSENKPYKFPFDVHWRKFNNRQIRFYCIIPHLINVTDVISDINKTKIPVSKIIFNSQKILLSNQ